MADADSIAAGLDEAGGQPAQSGPSSELAIRARAWFTEAWNHEIWRRYRKQATEDVGYYVGGDYQWSKDGDKTDLDRLKKSNRATVSVNHVQAQVDILTGFERQNRFDMRLLPQGEEDEGDARLMTWLLKFVREQGDFGAVESEAFEDGVIGGMAAVDTPIDWTEDPVNGKIGLDLLTPGEDVIWDPYWMKADLSDARYVIKFRTTFLSDLAAQYPKHEAKIREAVRAGAGTFKPGAPAGPLSEFDARDAYGTVKAHAEEATLAKLLYDEVSDTVLVLEPWYMEYESTWIVTNKASGQVKEAETEAAARQVAASDPDHLEAIERRRRVVKMGVVLPVANMTLEEDATPHENDDQAYPVVPYIAKRKRDDIYGVVRNLKDPQRIENKRESHALDILARLANIRLMAFTNSVENEADLKNQNSTEPVWVKPGHEKPSYLTPPIGEVVRVLTMEADRMKMVMREISGINTDLLGLKSDDTSGIAIARRQAQGQIISTIYFDNYRRFKRLVAQRICRRIQQVFTTERVVRLTTDQGEETVVKLNPIDLRGKTKDEATRLQAEQPDMFGPTKPKILRDVSALKYDVVISEAPSTPSMRQMELAGLLEVLKTVPGIAADVIDILIELMDLPHKPEILQRVKARMAAMGQPVPPGGAPGSMPGGSGGGTVEVPSRGMAGPGPGSQPPLIPPVGGATPPPSVVPRGMAG